MTGETAVNFGAIFEDLRRDEEKFLISFWAVQEIFICVYITNYLHFFAMFLSF